jgi:hypothetical protein
LFEAAGDHQRALDALDAAVARCGGEQGPTLGWIGLVWRAVAESLGREWREDGAMEECARALSLLGARVDVLRRWRARPTDPRDLLRATLPFNCC